MSLEVSNILPHAILRALFEAAIHAGRSYKARALCGALCAVSPLCSDLGAAAYVESIFCVAVQSQQLRRWRDASKVLCLLAHFCEVKGLQSQHARLLLARGEMQLEACARDPVRAVPVLLRCLSLCELCAMDSVHALATLALARAHLQLGDAQRANALLVAALPKVLEHATATDRGHAWLALAKCEILQMQTPTSNHTPQGQKAQNNAERAHVTIALHRLDKAIQAFEHVHHWKALSDAHYLRARVCHRIPDKRPERNESARHILRLGKLLCAKG